MGYTLFNAKVNQTGSPALTVHGDGKIGLNADAGDLLRQEGAKFVQILWDAGASKMALRPLLKSGESSFKLSTKSGRRGMVFSGLKFLRHIKWDFAKSAIIPIVWNEEEKLLEASLPRENFTGSANSSSGG
jgi:hypothetical protein